MAEAELNAVVEEWFLTEYGAGEVMQRIYDPGTGHGARIAEVEEARRRLRDDRTAGLYDDEADAQWYRDQYRRLGEELNELRALPSRPAGMRTVPTGRSVADDWHSAADDAARREMLDAFDVRVVLHPTGAAQRVAITAMQAAPGTEVLPAAA
jgi:hypothetical protein